MPTKILFPGLNDFCRKYLVANSQISASEVLLMESRYQEQLDAIFEHLLLFDRLSFKIYGENIPAAILLQELGEYAFDALIEQEAIGFTLWTPTVLTFKDDTPGLNALVSGNLNSPAHSDPEKSVELGLTWLRTPITNKKKKRLVKKLLPHYVVPSSDLAAKAVEITSSAYMSGKLSPYGFVAALQPLNNMSYEQRNRLCACATELLEYRFLIDQGMTSYSNYNYFQLFTESARRISKQSNLSHRVQELAEIEGVPTLTALRRMLSDPWRKVEKVRTSRNSRAFRNWLANVAPNESGIELTRAYVDSIANAKGLFDSAPTKFTKSIAMTAIGAGLGAAISESSAGALVGGLAAKLLEPGVGLGLDLLDSFLLDGLAKGWTPRMFFNDLRRLNVLAGGQKNSS